TSFLEATSNILSENEEFSDIWNCVNKDASLEHGHYKASCRPNDICLHLAQQCLNVPDDIRYFWRDFIIEEKESTQKSKNNQSEITTHF
ncbi:4835_t:CDS:2, partial [Cetraspora pellucida]